MNTALCLVDEGWQKEPDEVWYRISDHLESVADEFGDHAYTNVAVALHKYAVFRHTPCGVQLDVWGRARFVNRTARRRFACPTLAEALESFLARKNKERIHLLRRVSQVEEAMRQAYTSMELWTRDNKR